MEYAHRHLADVGLVWQFPAEDQGLLLAEFGRLAAQLGAREVVDARDPVASVHAVLAAFPAGWLLVFDNAPGQGAVHPFLPPAGRGRVLVTSQSAIWPQGWAVPVSALDTQLAAGFLVTQTGDPDEQAAAALAEGVGGAAAGAGAGRSVHPGGGDFLAGYLSVFRDRRAELLARGEAPAGHPAGVTATLGLALSGLEAEAPAAAGLLRLLACLAPEPVPIGLLLSDAQIAERLVPEIAAVVGSLLGDPIATGVAVAALRRFSLERVFCARLMRGDPLWASDLCRDALASAPDGQICVWSSLSRWSVPG